MNTHDVSSLTELEAFAKQLVTELSVNTDGAGGATVLAISGDLGAGKTTFVQHLARALGVTEVVTSPTFTIMKGYSVAKPPFTELVHMDAYRIEELAELAPLHFSEIVDTKGVLFCIEWAERIASALPKTYWQLSFTATAGGTRTVTVTPPKL